MNSYVELLNQFGQLKREVELARSRERDRYLRELVALLERNGVSLEDLLGYWKATTGSPRPRAKPKYFDPVTGRTWAGRGREPQWIRGKDRRDFLIEADSRGDRPAAGRGRDEMPAGGPAADDGHDDSAMNAPIRMTSTQAWRERAVGQDAETHDG
ncbi:H-NS histone family protein [Burkholderia stagnalis]